MMKNSSASNSVMISAIVSGVNTPVDLDGNALYKPMKFYQFSQLNDGTLEIIETYSIGNNLLSTTYLKDTLPAAEFPASIYDNGRYQDVMQSFAFMSDKIYFTVKAPNSSNESSIPLMDYIYSLDVNTLQVNLKWA